jgi:hypothetical protein
MRKLMITLFVLATSTAAVLSYYIGQAGEYHMEPWVSNYMVGMFSFVTFIILSSTASEFKWFERWTKNIRGYQTSMQPCIQLLPTILYSTSSSEYDDKHYREHHVVFIMPVFGMIATEWKYDLPLTPKPVELERDANGNIKPF